MSVENGEHADDEDGRRLGKERERHAGHGTEQAAEGFALGGLEIPQQGQVVEEELLGVEAVSAREGVVGLSTSADLQPLQEKSSGTSRAWWYEVGDYLERPHRHFEVMQSLRKNMEWPEHVKSQYSD